MNKLFTFAVCLFTVLVLSGCLASTQEPARQTTAAPEESLPTATEAVTTTPVHVFITVSREGETSQIPVDIIRGTVGLYTIAMDPEYFTFQPTETVDFFTYEGWEGADSVFYSISAYDEAEAGSFLENTRQQFGQIYANLESEEITLGGYPATAVRLSGYHDAPEYCKHLYLINCADTYYLIEAQFTMEMYEGLYAIMLACFDTFTAIG